MPRGSRRLILPLGFSPAKADADRAIASVAKRGGRPVAPLFVRSSQCMLHRYEPDAAGNLLSARADEAEPLVRPDR